jgi:putative endonuclease
MNYVYALYSAKIDRIYIGQTDDLERRLSDHLKGYSKYTKRADDWMLIFQQEFENRSEAMKRERQLKTSRGRAYLRNLLAEKH